jgi:S-adenosylmethionine hydrolase
MIKPSGVITITTDFGHKGPFAAVMKGVILSRFADARVIDLAHDIPPQWPPEAGFWVSRSYQYFPPGTVHVAIVDPGVGTEREILLVEHDGHVFLAPDNGLLGRLMDMAEVPVAYHLDATSFPTLNISNPSATFHGRDIFAPIAAEIAAGRISPAEIGRRTQDWVPAWLDEPDVRADKISGIVVTVDAFGNLISNIDASLLAGFDRPMARIGGHEIKMESTYGRVQPGDYLALINSFGVVEIAKAEGSAADGLGADRGAPIIISDS